MIVTRLALPVRSPMPLIVPWTWVAPASTALSVLATAQPVSSWVWMPSGDARQRFGDDGEGGPDLRRQAAAVGVAQHQALGAGPGGRAQAVQRIARVEAEAVEEVLGVEQHALAGARRGRRPSRRSSPGSPRARRARPSRRAATEALPTIVQAGAKDSASTRSPSSCSAARRAGGSCRRRRSAPARAARRRAGRTAPAPSGSRRGSRPRSCARPARRGRGRRAASPAAVSVMPPPPMPSRRVASYSSMRVVRCSSGVLSGVGAGDRERPAAPAALAGRAGNRAAAVARPGVSRSRGARRRATRGSARVRPWMASSKALCSTRVISPGSPVPTRWSSTSPTGTSSAAVPDMKTSSARYISARATLRSTIG